MKIVTWNVNSVRQRLEALMDLCQPSSSEEMHSKPDIILLQETKVLDEIFPREILEECGYNIATWGQKTFNGVAILSRYPLEDVVYSLPTLEDPQARYIEAFTGGVRVASVYVPNGQSVGSEKFAYKFSFLSALYEHLTALRAQGDPLVVGGDFNITVDDLDVYDPEGWKNEVLCHPQERDALQKILDLGFSDALRQSHPEGGIYTWWDYRQNSFVRNRGLRIDHLLLSSSVEDCFEKSGVWTHFRNREKPSDHAPVWVQLKSLV